MATELAAAYVTIIPSLKGAGTTIEKALGGVNTKGVSGSIGSSLTSGFGSTFKNIASIGAKVLGGIASYKFVQGGISRALALEQAEKKFNALGMDVESVMASCNESVTGTAYGLDAAATTAANLAASGVEAGDGMTNSLKAVAGLAAMSGRSMEDIGVIFSKVAAQGKLQGDEVMQFAESGVNVYGALADYMGVSMSEVKELISDGVVDFETFRNAMYQTFGEAAYGANETFSGAMANIGAALNRMTAKFATPALEGLRKIFVALIPAINAISACLDPLVEKFTAFVEAVSGHAVAGIEAFTSTLTETGSILQALKAGIAGLFEGSTIGKFFSGLGSSFGVFCDYLKEGASFSEALKMALSNLFGEMGVSLTPAIEKVREFVSAFKSDPFNVLKIAVQNLLNVFGVSLTPAIEGAKSLFSSLPQPIQNIITKFQEWFGTVNVGGAAAAAGFVAIMSKFGAPLTSLVTKLGGVGTAVAGFFGRFGSYGGIIGFLSTKMSTFGSAVTLCGGGVRGFATVVGSGLKTALTGLLNPVTLIVAGIAALAAAFIYMMSTNEVFRSNVMALVASIGQSLAPIIQTVVQTVTQLAANVLPVITNAIASLAPVLAQIVVVILQVVAALAPIIAQLVSALLPVIAEIITVVTNIIVAILPAVTAAINVVISIIQTLIPIVSSIISVVVSVVSAVVSAIGSVISVVGNILAVVGGAISTVIGFLGNILAVVVSVFGGIIGTVVSVISSVVGTILGGFSKAWNFISGIANSIGSCIGNLFSIISGIFNNIVSTIQNAVSTAFNAAKDAFNNIKDAVGDAIGNVLKTVGELPGKIKDFFKNAGEWLLNAGKNLIQGLWNGINNAKDWILDKISGFVDGIIGGIKDFFGIGSPSKVMAAEVGRFLPSGIGVGVTKYADEALDPMRDLTRQMVDEAQLMDEYLPSGKYSTDVNQFRKAEIVSTFEANQERDAMLNKALAALGDRIEGMQVVMDSGELVGATAGKYDKALSRRQLIAERGF